MKEYLMTVASASCAGIIADILNDAFCSRGKGIEKYIRFGITVCIACVIVVPLTGLVKHAEETNIPYFDEYQKGAYDEEADSLYIMEKECAEKLENEITEQTGVVPCDIKTEMILAENIPKIVETVIIIKPNDAEAAERIKRISLEALGTEAQVLIKETDEDTDG